MTVSSPRRRTLATLGAGALLLVLGACGGGPDASSAPKNADVDTFCAAVGDLDTSDVHEFVDTLMDLGTPKDIPADARAGFTVMVEKADQDEISEADQEKATAFVGYITSTCAKAG